MAFLGIVVVIFMVLIGIYYFVQRVRFKSDEEVIAEKNDFKSKGRVSGGDADFTFTEKKD